jgi:hypothetical protein
MLIAVIEIVTVLRFSADRIGLKVVSVDPEGIQA